MAGKYDKYRELTEGGPYDKSKHEIFKCTECGAESEAGEDWNGEPDPGLCAGHCSSRDSDWSPGRVSNSYRDNYDRTFPNAVGAGI